jgi:hypothetical protein
MANWIKWWKSKFAWNIIGMVISAMTLSFLSAYFLIDPINWILAIIIVMLFGFGIRKTIIKKIDSLVK